MKAYSEYWIAAMIRGLLAIVAGTGVLFIPEMASTISIALLFGRNLSPRELAWLIYGYLGLFGFNLFALSARMLFAEQELLQVAHV
jgi:hypothetical protein